MDLGLDDVRVCILDGDGWGRYAPGEIDSGFGASVFGVNVEVDLIEDRKEVGKEALVHLHAYNRCSLCNAVELAYRFGCDARSVASTIVCFGQSVRGGVTAEFLRCRSAIDPVWIYPAAEILPRDLLAVGPIDFKIELRITFVTEM